MRVTCGGKALRTALLDQMVEIDCCEGKALPAQEPPTHFIDQTGLVGDRDRY